MKRFLCLMLCLLLAAPAALADTYTPTRLFRQQFVTGGNGLRGTVAITASGVADWLQLIMPFAGTKLQVRIIGERQGGESALVTDDDDWQVKIWAKDAQDGQHGLTYLYGGPEALYMKSDLLPDTLLTLPVKNLHPLYQLTDAQFLPMLTALDPMGLMSADNGGNTTAWSALLDVAAISGEEWEARWWPVLEKYATLVDMWLAGYASPTVVSGNAGSMTLRTSYEIPADAIKAQTKYVIGLMLVDGDLQNLLDPYLTDEQHSLYLNPAMLWFYEHCIDVAPLSGSVLLEREMTMMGETTALGISLPLPTLPQELTTGLSEILCGIYGLPEGDLFAGMERISIRQAGEDMSVSLSGAQRTISLILDERAENAESVQCSGFLRITPAVGSSEAPLSAAFAYRTSQRIWEDEDYSTHEDFTWAIETAPDESVISEDDPFGSTYVEFAPLSLSASVGFIKKDKEGAPVQLNIDLAAVLADAEVTVDANLRTAERWNHEVLPVTGAENLTVMSDARREELRTMFVTNALQTMTQLLAQPTEAGAAQ